MTSGRHTVFNFLALNTVGSLTQSRTTLILLGESGFKKIFEE